MFCTEYNLLCSAIPFIAKKEAFYEDGFRTQNLIKANESSKPLLTILTIVYNDVHNIEQTILSVLKQNYNNLEYIIIDGGSTDGTVDVIKKYAYALDYVCSEPDGGIYDAMNKGIALAYGNYIAFMNSGDYYPPSVLHDVAMMLKDSSIDVLYGDYYTFKKGKLGSILNTPDPLKELKTHMIFNHQASFTKVSLLRELGGYKKEFYPLSDHAFYMQAFLLKKNFIYKAGALSYYSLDGVSSNFKNKLDVLKNIQKHHTIYNEKEFKKFKRRLALANFRSQIINILSPKMVVKIRNLKHSIFKKNKS